MVICYSQRAKKVFDPSDNNIPKKRGRPVGSLNKSTIERHNLAKLSDNDSRPESRSSNPSRDHGVCSVCHLQSKKGPSDRMVSCRECSNKGEFINILCSFFKFIAIFIIIKSQKQPQVF